MWAGTTTTEHDNAPFEERHKPTGIRLLQPEWAPHGTPQGAWTLRSGPGADWAAEFRITYVRPERRQRAPGVTYNGPRDSERFRRALGDLSTLDRAVPVAPGGPVPRDAAPAETFATLFFIMIMHDTEGFASGRAAYPDSIELKALELPSELRGTVVADRYTPAPP